MIGGRDSDGKTKTRLLLTQGTKEIWLSFSVSEKESEWIAFEINKVLENIRKVQDHV